MNFKRHKISILTAILFASSCAASQAQEKKTVAVNQIGRYSLHILNKGEEHVLYRLDTVSGTVSIFDPTAINTIAQEDWASLPKALKEFAEMQKSAGKIVYESPYWKELPEKLSGVSVR